MSKSPASPPKAKKKESWLGVAFVAVVCVAFLAWWFAIDPVPDSVGPAGLADRGLEEISQSEGGTLPLAVEFDVLELAMLQIRAGNTTEAQRLIEKLAHPALRRKAWRELALSHLNKPSGDYSPALQVLKAIPDEEIRAAVRVAVITELAAMGMTDIAAELAGTDVGLKAKLCRMQAESADPKGAEEALKTLLPSITPDMPDAYTDVAWTKLWLRQTAEVEAMISKIPANRQEELWQDLYRLVRSEKPAELAELTTRMPSHLLLPLRIESARLIGSSESPEMLLQELKSAAEKETTWSAWLQYARAAWKLAQTEEIWRPALQTSLDLAKKLSGADQCLALGEIGGLMMDGGEFASGRTALQQAQVAAGQEADPARKLHGLAQLHQLAFRSSEPDEARKILTELDALRIQSPLAPPDAQILATALFKSGSWAEAISLAQSLPDQDLVSPLAHLVLESTAAHGFELSQDKSYAKLRQVAISQGEAAAAAMNMREDPGLRRGRGWLEMAKAGAVRMASP